MDLEVVLVLIYRLVFVFFSLVATSLYESTGDLDPLASILVAWTLIEICYELIQWQRRRELEQFFWQEFNRNIDLRTPLR